MKSFGLLRTNVGLTTNVKIVIDSEYGFSLDSINSVPELSYSKYKAMSFNKDNYYDELLPFFYKGMKSEIAFNIKYDNDSDSMSDNFSNQYDNLYNCGARNIIDNKNYKEEFEYFAPLYIYKNKIPKKFIIFRVDNPGIGNVNKSNIKKDILQNFKTVKLFDLTNKTKFGQWMDLNVNNNDFFTETPFDMSFTRIEFSSWNGIDYKSGGYVNRSMFLDDVFEEEKEIFSLEKFIFDGFKDNKVIFSNIMNFTFLFDDTPATDKSLRKWSINRYYGFYLDDMELISGISPYITPLLKSDISISEDNILSSNSGDPFLNGWSDRPTYIEYENSYYKVEKFKEIQDKSVNPVNLNKSTTQNDTVQVSSVNMIDANVQEIKNVVTDEVTTSFVDKWKIISDTSLEGKQLLINKNTGYIRSDKVLINYDQSNLIIKDFELADIWVIEIDGKYHNLIKDIDGIKINSDYSFKFYENEYSYYINSSDSSYETKVSILVDDNNKPKSFGIYRLKLSDIKDFDNRIVDTEFSKFEYEKENELTETEETKMYVTNLNSNSNPKDLDDFRINGKVVNVPVSSEYTANNETFKITNDELSPIWRKNPVYCRWMFDGSLSSNDYPYILNNSNIFEGFNRTTNVFDVDPNRMERNLDYFYTINSSTYSYSHHTLHIEENNDDGINDKFNFDLDKYLNIDTYDTKSTKYYKFDYFSHFFNRNMKFVNNEVNKNFKKYSLLTPGDNTTPNITLFRGIKFLIYDVDKVKLNTNNKIESINIKSSNKFDDYKLSILLTSSDNGMRWDIINKWNMDTYFTKGKIVSHNDILYKCNKDHITDLPTLAFNNINYQTGPYNTTNWDLYENNKSPFWNPKGSYYEDDYVYNGGNYYKYVGSLPISFWNANSLIILESNEIKYFNTYLKGSKVIFNGKYYECINLNGSAKIPTDILDWIEIDSVDSSLCSWVIISLWNNSSSYNKDTLKVYNNILYKSNSTSIPGEVPIKSTLWDRIYSLESDTDYIYKINNNPFLLMNGEYYLLLNNINNKTLDNGINIYINKKYKNILINIYINDNTINNLRDKDRDDLYKSISKKLTANNFIECINNLSLKHDFSDYLNYIIIDENGVRKTYNYDNNIEELPHIIFAEKPESLSVKVNSLEHTAVNIDKLKATKILNDGRIHNKYELNYFNKTHIGSTINENNYTPLVLPNYHGSVNIQNSNIYRFSGKYTPLFYDIQLFKADNSISYNEMNISLYTKELERVNFIVTMNGIKTEKLFDIYPGISYSTPYDYYKQVMNILNNDIIFNKTEFIFKVNKNDLYLKDSLLFDFNSINYNSVDRILPDLTNNINNGLLSGDITYVNNSTVYPGPHLQFNGITQSTIKVKVGSINKSSTIEAFVMFITQSNSYNTLIGSDDFSIGLLNNNQIFFKDKYVSNDVDIVSINYSNTDIKLGIWYHLVCTTEYDLEKDISYNNIYIDGYENYLGLTGCTGSKSNITDIIIGDSTILINGHSPFKGSFSGLRVYDRLLTQDEIKYNYVNRHDLLSIKYKSTVGDIKIELSRIYPSLIIDIIDDDSNIDIDFIIGATGGTPPYTWSHNHHNQGLFSTNNSFIYDINKGLSNYIRVKDSIGLISDIGYYTINMGNIQYPISGTFSY